MRYYLPASPVEKGRHKLAFIWTILVLTSAGLPILQRFAKVHLGREHHPKLSRSRCNWSRKEMSALWAGKRILSLLSSHPLYTFEPVWNASHMSIEGRVSIIDRPLPAPAVDTASSLVYVFPIHLQFAPSDNVAWYISWEFLPSFCFVLFLYEAQL